MQSIQLEQWRVVKLFVLTQWWRHVFDGRHVTEPRRPVAWKWKNLDGTINHISYKTALSTCFCIQCVDLAAVSHDFPAYNSLRKRTQVNWILHQIAKCAVGMREWVRVYIGDL
jgi:hypothetical protein